MIEKLNIVKQRFDEVSDLIIQPNIISDQDKYVKLTKEYKDLKDLMDKREEYLELTNNMVVMKKCLKWPRCKWKRPKGLCQSWKRILN